MATAEFKATAEFNTKILSPRQEGKVLSYNLDEVIDKDFDGPYLYTVNVEEVPSGVNVKDGILTIPANVEFELVVVVSDEGKINIAEAITDVVLESDKFSDALQSFLNNENLQQNLNATKEEWSNIINRNNGNNPEEPVRPK